MPGLNSWVHYTAYDQIGFQFNEQVALYANGTHYYGGYRVDESVQMSWSSMYSNMIDIDVVPVSPSWPGGSEYQGTIDLFQTFTNLKDAQKQFYYQFTTVWSDPSTFTYLKHSNWTGSGVIVDVFHVTTPAAVPEPTTALLILPALIGLYHARKRLV